MGGWLEPSSAQDGQHRPLRSAQVRGHQGCSPCTQPQGVQGCGQDQPSEEHQEHAAAQPFAAVVKKNAELTKEKNLRAKALKEAKATGKPAPANPMAKRA